MAGPIWNLSETPGAGAGPLLLLIDDGWPAAPAWERRIAYARDALRSATRAGRLAAVLPISARRARRRAARRPAHRRKTARAGAGSLCAAARVDAAGDRPLSRRQSASRDRLDRRRNRPRRRRRLRAEPGGGRSRPHAFRHNGSLDAGRRRRGRESRRGPRGASDARRRECATSRPRARARRPGPLDRRSAVRLRRDAGGRSEFRSAGRAAQSGFAGRRRRRRIGGRGLARRRTLAATAGGDLFRRQRRRRAAAVVAHLLHQARAGPLRGNSRVARRGERSDRLAARRKSRPCSCSPT